MKKIGFFGGCFNPPTNMHIKIANNLIKERKLDKVVFVPMNDLYKKEGLVEAKHRYDMLKLAISEASSRDNSYRANENADKIQEVLLTIPNMIDETVPIGKDSNDNKEIRRYGT